MFFEKAARAVAYLMVIMSVFRIAMTLFVIFAYGGHPEAIASFLGSFENTGEAMDQAIRWLGIAIVFGVLAEIARSVRRSNKEADSE